MKKMFIIAAWLCLPTIVLAQDIPVVAPTAPAGALTLGGIPNLIAEKLQETKPCGIVDLTGKTGGGAYLPLWTFHDQAGHNYVEALDFGYRALSGAKPSGFVMPFAIDLTQISARLWNWDWATKHVTRSKFPDVFVGGGPILPFDKTQLQTLKIGQPKDWMAFAASVRF